MAIGDLVLCRAPDGMLRLSEQVGKSVCGWGDVVFEMQSETYGKHTCVPTIDRGVRNGAIDRLIGHPFDDVFACRDAVLAADPDAANRDKNVGNYHYQLAQPREESK